MYGASGGVSMCHLPMALRTSRRWRRVGHVPRADEWNGRPSLSDTVGQQGDNRQRSHYAELGLRYSAEYFTL